MRKVLTQRRSIFVGCEGDSEFNYVAWLRNILRDKNLPIHLEPFNLGKGAGDPLARVELAVDRLERLKVSRTRFVGRFLLLDTDQTSISPDRADKAKSVALANKIIIIWQHPTHEAFLLRHLPNCHSLRPPTKQRADAALLRQWSNYRKPMSARDLEKRLDLAGALRSASVTPEFLALLHMCRLTMGKP